MRTNEQWLTEKPIAHRGLHSQGIPENSIAAFSAAIAKGIAIEFDVHIIADQELIVFHDDDLKRVCGTDMQTKDLKTEQLKQSFLLNTKQTIPTFKEVLELVDGKVPLLIEIKNTGKVGVLEEKLYNQLKQYKGRYAIMSFNPFSLLWFTQNAPEVARGQLSSFFKGEKLALYKKNMLKRMMFNNKTKPHFIAYHCKDIPNKYVNKYIAKNKDIPLLCWTVKSKEEQARLKTLCTNIIFESFDAE